MNAKILSPTIIHFRIFYFYLTYQKIQQVQCTHNFTSFMWLYEELYDSYHSPNISGQIKKNKMGWTCGTYWGKVRRMFWWGNPRKIDHLSDLDIEGILK